MAFENEKPSGRAGRRTRLSHKFLLAGVAVGAILPHKGAGGTPNDCHTLLEAAAKGTPGTLP